VVEIEPAAAKALARHSRNIVYLDGLVELSPEVAVAFAEEDGELSLSGIATITDEAARTLVRGNGFMHFVGLQSISPEALAILRANPRIELPEDLD
jgi:hypothetical protein